MNSEFDMGQSQGQKLVFAFRRNNQGNPLLEWLSTGDNLSLVGRLQRGEAELVDRITPAPEVVISPIIRVDRFERPSYPRWLKKVMYPELENTGPAEYSVETIQLWLHDDQKSGAIGGNIIHDTLKETSSLKSCLGLRDLEEIQKKGIAFFRKHFRGKAIFAWRSVVQYDNGGLYVPYLYVSSDKVVLDWNYVGNNFGSNDPAARLES